MRAHEMALERAQVADNSRKLGIAPPPYCGQVWQEDTEDSPAVTVVSDSWPWFAHAFAAIMVQKLTGVPAPTMDRTWPPKNAHLIAGLGSPWSPPTDTE